jgi:hypothetical protein
MRQTANLERFPTAFEAIFMVNLNGKRSNPTLPIGAPDRDFYGVFARKRETNQ